MINGFNRNPVFYKGILSTDLEVKGPVLGAFLDQVKLKPHKIVMFDDDLPCLQSVQQECEKRGIAFHGYQYLGAHAKPWDEAIVQFQADYLIKHKKWLNNDEAKKKIKSITPFPDSVSTQDNQQSKKQIKIAIDQLNTNNPFVIFALGLTEEEKNILKKLQINTTEVYNNYGSLKDLNAEIRTFIKSLNKENKAIAETASQIIVRIVNDIIQASGQETAWVAVRSFTPTSEYDIPRWHKDGYYYAPYEGDPYKFAVTLKGSSTLFYSLPTHMREKFYALEKGGTEENSYNRQALATLLGQSKGPISIAQP
ncbi:MAG: DUF2608 domain-containing protein [Alphaproteobacteria bacterium]|nr:DUF2608 domain-containing protein [Alphaproteobacteria bacterium]